MEVYHILILTFSIYLVAFIGLLIHTLFNESKFKENLYKTVLLVMGAIVGLMVVLFYFDDILELVGKMFN